MDLGKEYRVDAIQINFADQSARTTNVLDSQNYYYHVEASRDGKEWQTIIDRQKAGRDARMITFNSARR